MSTTMEKSGKPSGSKARAGKARDRAGRTPNPHPNALFSSSADGDPVGPRGAPDADIPDTGAMPTAIGIEAKLVIEKGLHAGKVLKLGAGTAVIGRSSKCELSLKGSSGVSRRHCKVQFIGNQYALIDLESRNGTLVNGKVQPRFILKDGDLIEVCDEQIRFASIQSGPKAIGADDDIAERETALLDPAAAKAAIAALKEPLPPLPDLKPPPVDDDLVAATRMERSRPSQPSRPVAAASRPPPLPAKGEDERPDLTAPLLQPNLEEIDAAAPTQPQRAPKIPARPPPLPRDRAPVKRGGFDDLQAETQRGPPLKSEGGGFRGVHAVLLLMLVLLAALGVAAWDLTIGPKRLKALVASFQIQEGQAAAKADEPKPDEPKADEPKPDQPNADEAKADEPKPDEPKADEPKADEPKPDEPKPDEPKPDEPKADEPKADEPKGAQALVDAAKADGPTGAAAPPDPAMASPPVQAAALEVTAKVGGTVARVVVKPGQKIAKGAVLAQLDGGGGANKKKLDVLYGEKRDFEAAVKRGIASAKRDLESVEREIASLERARKSVAIVASDAGVIIDVKVQAGDVVKPGDVVVTVQP
jgi:biotin carboxyl carrier protein